MIDRDIGAYIKVVKGINPANAAAGTINGAAIDRAGIGGKNQFMSCVLKISCGAASGGPSAQTVNAKLQDSSDGSSGWADISGAAVTQLTADNGESQVNVDLSAAKRHIRAVVTVGFTGGTSPAIPVAAELILGGAQTLPV
ncbi:MAG TPA: hypothetical protein VNL14_16710 [Candidatus Acidoferrales bacterium]|nr:hypothetical protein [Candidatus Acidoferrales bacterium]